jgi:glycosyltransferase involved in cell wall biosynthesis
VKIAVNTRLLIPNRLEGIGRFTYEIFKRLVTTHPEVEFHFFSDRNPQTEWQFGNNVFQHKLFPPARRPFLFDFWFDYSVPRKMKQLNIDLFVSPDGHASRKIKNQLCVIHDLNFMHHPEFLDKKYATYWRKRTPEFIASSSRIATVSEFSKNDIKRTFQVSSNIIDVIGNGFDKSKFHSFTEIEKQEFRVDINSGRPYFLFVGSLHPRKNVHRIVQAFNAFSKVNSTHDLIIVGRLFWKYPDLERQLREALPNRIKKVGFISNAELPNYYAAAEALVFPSLYEGFGIPLLEAEMCNTAVIATKESVMEEVSNGSAWFVDAYDVSTIESAMRSIAAGERKEKTRNTEEIYTWELAAVRMWKSINDAIKK